MQTIVYVLEGQINTMKVPNVLSTKIMKMSGITENGVTLQQILAQMPEIIQMMMSQAMVQVVLLVAKVSVQIRGAINCIVN